MLACLVMPDALPFPYLGLSSFDGATALASAMLAIAVAFSAGGDGGRRSPEYPARSDLISPGLLGQLP